MDSTHRGRVKEAVRAILEAALDGVTDLRERAEIYFAFKEIADALGAELSEAGVRAYGAAAEQAAATDRDDPCPACGSLFSPPWNPNKERWCNRCQSWFPDPRFHRGGRDESGVP